MATDSAKHEEPKEAELVEKRVEIERKFTVTNDAGERILQAGGKCVKEATFEDTYFDTNSYQLTIADHWLRKRDGSWELKAAIHKDKLNETCTKYVEIEVESDIMLRLDAILGEHVNPEVNSEQQQQSPSTRSNISLEEYLKQRDVQDFATFKTTRKYYQIEDDISVVLDTTDFGFNIGEIEIMASEIEMDKAVERLEKLSEDLGFGDLSALNFDLFMPQSWQQEAEDDDGQETESHHL